MLQVYVYSDVVNIGCFPDVTVLELLQKSTSLKTFSIIQCSYVTMLRQFYIIQSVLSSVCHMHVRVAFYILYQCKCKHFLLQINTYVLYKKRDICCLLLLCYGWNKLPTGARPFIYVSRNTYYYSSTLYICFLRENIISSLLQIRNYCYDIYFGIQIIPLHQV